MVGLVLAGGFSRRFGSDKSLAVLPGSRDPLVKRAALLLSAAGMDDVRISCRAEQAPRIMEAAPGYALIRDMPHAGASSPIFGLISALRELRHAPLLTLPCDMPSLTPAMLRMLIDERRRILRQSFARSLPLRYAFVHPDGRVETLVAIYEPTSLPLLSAAAAAGRLSAYSAIPSPLQWLVPCPDSWDCINMNAMPASSSA